MQFAQNKKIEQKWGCMTHDFNWHVKWSVTQQKYRWPKKSFSRKFYEFQVSDHANIGGIYLSFMRNWQMKCASLVDYMNTCKVICMPKWYKNMLYFSIKTSSRKSKLTRCSNECFKDSCKVHANDVWLFHRSKTGMLTCRRKSWPLRSLVKVLRNFALIAALAIKVSKTNHTLKWLHEMKRVSLYCFVLLPSD